MISTPFHLSRSAASKRFFNIDFLRFFFALTVCYCHALYNFPLYENIQHYQLLFQSHENTQIASDFFFIIAGFFLFYKPPVDLGTFLKKRLIRLLPTFYICLILCIGLAALGINYHPTAFQHTDMMGILPNLFMLDFFSDQSILPLSWFLNCLFWISLFYFVLSRQTNPKTFLLLLSIISFMGFCLIANNGIGFDKIYLGIFKLGIIRSIVGIAMGIMIYYAYRASGKTKIPVLITNICEIALSIYIIKGLFFTPFLAYPNLIIAFVLLFYLFLLNKGIVSKILNKPYWKFFGDISYMLFFIHIPAFAIIKAILYLYIKPTGALSYIAWLIGLSVIVAIIFYLFFEKKIQTYLGNKFLRRD